MKKVLVSSPPPTANGDLHVGHLSGPFLRADTLRRYSRMRGREVYCLCGADEHPSYVAFRAEQMGLTPQEAVDGFSEAIRKTLRAARIDVDVFMRTSRSAVHRRLAQEMFSKLYAAGKLIAKQEPSPYCENCEQHLFEVYLSGECPHCGAGSCGNACEGCGRPNQCVDLKNPVCNRCGAAPTMRPYKRLYFPLGAYERQLRTYYQTVVMNPRLRALCEGMLEDGLPDIAVGHPAAWGIPVPVPEFEGQTIYVWFEVAAGLLSSTQELSEKLGMEGGWRTFWHADDVDVVQFCGFDNGYFYGMLIPALLLAYDPQIKLAKAVLLNEFYHLDGSKFSTSRNHAIWGRELLEREPVDAVRFYLALSGPETEQTNFTLAEYEETVGRELASHWQGWLRELGTKLSDEYGSLAPAVGVWTDEQHQFYEKLRACIAEAAAAYEAESFSPRRAARVLLEVVRAAREFGAASDEQQRQNAQRSVRRTGLALELAAAKTLAVLSGPLMPEFSERLWRDLGNDTPSLDGIWEENPQWVPSGTRINQLTRPYFPGLDRSA